LPNAASQAETRALASVQKVTIKERSNDSPVHAGNTILKYTAD
jgi:hypothetical protein